MTWRKKEIAEQVEKDNEPQKPFRVEFAPGCFDGFEGTQEELDELIAMIHAKVADGSIITESRLLDEEESEEVVEEILERIETSNNRTLQ